jgi:4-hydroxythreonine-4-phosphate dehydrogenase
LKPIIAVTMGDAAGIGPEIIAKTLSMKEIYEICKPIVIGDSDALRMGVEVSNLDLEIHPVKKISESFFQCGKIDVIDLENINGQKLVMGKPQAMAGKASVEYVLKAAELAINNRVEAIVTAPLNKEAMNMAGYSYTGHTELLAEFSNVDDFAMLLLAGAVRVIHVTTHVALKDVPALITRERVLRTIILAVQAAINLGIGKPRIAVAGLNPHSGEGGLFGSEEIEAILPAIEEARESGLNVEGPIPPDTVFVKAAGGTYDMVVAMYHDQGHIPVKLIGFKWSGDSGLWEAVEGVNITIGLPFIRTSVDHGQSLIEAIMAAVKIAEAKRMTTKS